MEETPKKAFKIDFFQTARVHTEQVVQEFESEAEARKYAEAMCEEKDIKPDFEVNEVVAVAPDTTTTDVGVDAAPATEE